MELRKEIAELVNELTGATHPEEAVLLRLAHASVEFVDVAGAIVKTLDKPNLENDLASLSNELIAAAEAVIDKFLGDKPARAIVAKSVAAFLIPSAVTQLGVTYSGKVDDFRVGYLLPVFKQIEDFGHRGVIAFGE